MRLNVVTDLDLTRPITEHATLKRVIFGEPVMARPIYREPVSFTPRAAHIWCANGFPQIPGADSAVWDRLLPLPVVGKRWRGTSDERHALAQELRQQELAGILSRFLAAAQRELARRAQHAQAPMTPPAPSHATLDQWRDESDSVALWASERLGEAKTLAESVSPGRGWEDYKRWCEQGGYQRCTKRTWGKRLLQRLGVDQWSLCAGSRKIPYKCITHQSAD